MNGLPFKHSLPSRAKIARKAAKVDHHKFRDDLLPKLKVQSDYSIVPKWSEWWNQPESRRNPVSWGIVGLGLVILLSLGGAGIYFGVVGLPKSVSSNHDKGSTIEEEDWVNTPHANIEDTVEFVDEQPVEEVPVPTLQQALLDVRNEDIEAARDVLWKFVVAKNPEDRIAHTLRPETNAPHIIAHHKRNPGLVVSDVRIETMKAWDGPTGLNIAFKTFTDYNRSGCVVEVVCTEEKEYRISWQRFDQHHYGTFRQFYLEKSESEQRFYLTAIRRHVIGSDLMPSWLEVDSYAISGTNPNHYVTVFVERSKQVAEDLEKGVPWATRTTIKAELQWRSNPEAPDERFLFIDNFLGSGWGGDLYDRP